MLFLYFLKELQNDELNYPIDIKDGFKDDEASIPNHKSGNVSNVSSKTQDNLEPHTEKKEISSVVGNMSTIMSSILHTPVKNERNDSTNNVESRNIEDNKKLNILDSDQNNELVMARNNLKTVGLPDHCSSLQQTEQHTSISEEDHGLNKKKNDGDRSHEGKRIAPPKDVQPVIAGMVLSNTHTHIYIYNTSSHKLFGANQLFLYRKCSNFRFYVC